jgi:glycosyltransferase involved in cell wall biosynthesis
MGYARRQGVCEHRAVSVERHLFIAGCPRSGTSALTFLLNEHPQLAIGFERFKRVRAQLDPFHFTPGQFFSPVAAETDIRGERLYARLWRRWESGAVRVIGDKVPLYTRVLPQLLGRFADARIVVLVREPLAVARSFDRRAADPDDWWPAENDHRLAITMWNEALTAVRAVDRERAGADWGEGRVALLPYEALFAGEQRWLDFMLAFIGIPTSARVRGEQRRLAVGGLGDGASRRARGVAGAQTGIGARVGTAHVEQSQREALEEYVHTNVDGDLAQWARMRMEAQLRLLSDGDELLNGDVVVGDAVMGDAVVGDAVVGGAVVGDVVVGDAEMADAEVVMREREREELLEEMRRPGRRADDELGVLERRLVEQAGELARRGERRLQAGDGQPRSAGEWLQEVGDERLRITFIAPHLRATTGGTYVIEQFARHLAVEHEVHLAVREQPSRSIPGVQMRWLEQLDGDALPRADVLVYPADMRDAGALAQLPAQVGRPVMLFQGYGTPGSPVVEANLARAENAVAIARWLTDLALARGIHCAYVPQGLDRQVFAPGPPPAGRDQRVSLMTHRLGWKGLDDALKAVAIVRSQRPDVEVVLFGVHPVEGIGSFMESPSRPQVAELLRASAVHIVASWEEGFGLTGAEAIACGAALASTDTKGSRDYAIDGHTALVSAPRDPQALAENVLTLLGDAGLRTRLVSAGQRHLRTAMPPWEEAARRLQLALLDV